MSRIRVLHVITSLDQGGAETMLLKLCGAMDRARFDLKVVSLLPGGVLAREFEEIGIPVDELGMRPGRPNFRAILELRRIIRAFQPDILQSWLYHADLLSTLAWMSVGRGELAWNLRCSEMDFTKYGPMTRWVVRCLTFLSHKPSVIVSNSNVACEIHQRLGYKAKAWQVLPNGFDLHRFKPDTAARERLRADWNVPDGMRLVGLPARMDPQKDHAAFLDALKRISDRGMAVRGVLVGKGTEPGSEEMDRLIERIAPDVPLMRLGARFDMPDIYNALDLVVLSSAYGEGFPNVLGEALASGVPAIATDVGDSRIILEGLGEAYEIVPASDVERLAAGMTRILNAPAAKVSASREAGRNRIAAHYSLPVIGERYEALYASLSEGNMVPACVE